VHVALEGDKFWIETKARDLVIPLMSTVPFLVIQQLDGPLILLIRTNLSHVLLGASSSFRRAITSRLVVSFTEHDACDI